MPAFFFPGAANRAAAEAAYEQLVENATGGKPNASAGRIYSIGFVDRGKPILARVGEEITEFRGISGVVLAITETDGLIRVHTPSRPGRFAIEVNSSEVSGRIYFDDFPGPENAI